MTMKNRFCFVMAVALLVLLLSSGSAMAYTVRGDFKDAPYTASLSTGGDLLTIINGTCGGVMGSVYDKNNYYPPELQINPTNHNWVEGDYVLVTGQNGETALYSYGELDTKFAQGNTVTLTEQNNGQVDLAGLGREIKDVNSIDVVHAVDVVKGGTRFYSQQFIVSGEGITPKVLNLSDLQGMTQVTSRIKNTKNNVTTDWTGPTLLSTLKASGVNTTDMTSYVVVSGPDGFATVLSMYEATHALSGLYSDPAYSQYDMLAITGDNTLNVAKNESDNGFARLVIPGDNVNGRWTSNVYQIVVYDLTSSSTPAPSSDASFVATPTNAEKGSAVKFTVTPASGKIISSAWWSFDATTHMNTWNSRAVNPTFFYPRAGTFTPLVKLTYTDGSTETVQLTDYIQAT
ncbi:hypothetical protein Mpal_0626 [Methanosphaerula palustris E1-9c]|uniref:PKD domain-containing protein n=2 Tax=Methanosphaerula palustris TaxID=475088 RepID=B8GFE9_METPE|nr:hypothetical protein Mpal_0626 [Methanosphaerula palustris E1-9c]